VSWEGAVFRKISDAILTGPPSAKAAAIGVDWARGAGGDYTVFTVISDAGDVQEIDRFRGPTIIAEANAMGGPVIDQLQRDGDCGYGLF
jgi:hypothetical protein